ncbi:MAG TPA: PQQ-binding-like beta-propeller repeat protein [Urbifossiella sp.]|nr:PQQ-binding-like beta-propeller repeat protein [Urbifossiella sp.]
MLIALAASLVSFAIALIGCGGPAESQQSEASSPAATARTAPLAMGTDWPRFLGPNQDSVSTEKGIIAPWPKQGLGKVWECSLGLGYTPPIISGGKLFHFDRFDDNCRLTCRGAATGKFLWKFEYPTSYEDYYGYDPGPRATPTVDGDRAYIYGPDGMLFCLKTDDGKELWHLDLRAKYRFHQNFFGVGGAPLIDGDLVIVAVGGSDKGPRPPDLRLARPNGTAIVGIDKKTGAVKYAKGNELASYSSPIVRTIDGKRTGLYFARGGLLGFDPQSGDPRFHYKWRAPIEESVNAANPITVGNRVFLSECYGPGSALLEIASDKPKEVWTDLEKEKFDKSLMCHWNTPIFHDGFVYGCSGRHDTEADLRCIELKTGDVKWIEKRTKRCSLLMVDGYFVCLSEYGTLSLLKVNAAKYDEVSKYEVPELQYPCWAAPVLSGGLLYVRGKGKLLCLELIPEKK